jgi:hypothetical protein
MVNHLALDGTTIHFTALGWAITVGAVTVLWCFGGTAALVRTRPWFLNDMRELVEDVKRDGAKAHREAIKDVFFLYCVYMGPVIWLVLLLMLFVRKDKKNDTRN